MPRFKGSCYSLEKDFPILKQHRIKCCPSCVSDMEYEIPTHEVYDAKDNWYEVCCDHQMAFEKYIK